MKHFRIDISRLLSTICISSGAVLCVILNLRFRMYNKVRLMGDTETAEEILQAETPAIAKTKGREVKRFQQHLWDAGRSFVFC